MWTFEKSGFQSKLEKNSDFGQNLWKYRLWRRSSKYLDFGQIVKKFDFGQNFWKILSEVEIVEISRFLTKLRKIAILEQSLKISILVKFKFWSNFSIHLGFG